jgi:hypothetical protein
MEGKNGIAEAVKKLQKGSRIIDLVFNPVTGDFEEIPNGMVPAVGNVVTGISRIGFA